MNRTKPYALQAKTAHNFASPYLGITPELLYIIYSLKCGVCDLTCNCTCNSLHPQMN